MNRRRNYVCKNDFVLLVFALAGCATARKGNELQAQQLQSRISHLDAELERKNQEILSLEEE